VLKEEGRWGSIPSDEGFVIQRGGSARRFLGKMVVERHVLMEKTWWNIKV